MPFVCLRVRPKNERLAFQRIISILPNEGQVFYIRGFDSCANFDLIMVFIFGGRVAARMICFFLKFCWRSVVLASPDSPGIVWNFY